MARGTSHNPIDIHDATNLIRDLELNLSFFLKTREASKAGWLSGAGTFYMSELKQENNQNTFSTSYKKGH